MTPTFDVDRNKVFSQRMAAAWESGMLQKLDARFEDDALLRDFALKNNEAIQAARKADFGGWQFSIEEIDAIERILNDKRDAENAAQLKAQNQHAAARKLIDFAKSRSFDAREPFDGKVYALLLSLGLQDARKATGDEGVWESVALDSLLELVAGIPEGYESPLPVQDETQLDGAELLEAAEEARTILETHMPEEPPPQMVEETESFESTPVRENKSVRDLDNFAMDIIGALEWGDAPSAYEIVRECLEVAQMLVRKNKNYGDSALSPLRVFSRASSIEQIYVRLDDKLSRIKRGRGEETEDVEADILGYLMLLRVAKRRTAKSDKFAMLPAAMVAYAKAMEPLMLDEGEEVLRAARTAGLTDAETQQLMGSMELLRKIARGERVCESELGVLSAINADEILEKLITLLGAEESGPDALSGFDDATPGSFSPV